MRLWPRSLLGQTLLAVALALLAAQHLSAYLLYRAAEDRRETALINAVAFHMVGGARMGARERPEAIRRDRGSGLESGSGYGRRSGFPRRLHYRTADASPALPGETREPAREAALTSLLERQGIAVAEISVTERPLARDPLAAEAMQRFPRLRERIDGERDILVAGLRRQGAAQWEVVRVPVRARDARVLPAIVLQTLVLFVVLMLLLWLVLRRITRPLAQLRARTESFAGSGAPSEPLEPSGPSDVSSLIAAHNRMEARIGAMLDEKDVMLGAIGHDLKTPLAALRVRIESVEDETERAKMAAGIEDITRSLDDILSLARVGRATEPPERAELSALAGAVVEEFEDMGQPVEMADTVRLVRPVHVTWLRRGLRNLIANAVRYGGGARVSLLEEGDAAVLRVEDDGPGIDPARIADMPEPFTRGEASRNRETGGAGLGLTLARAIAEQHGGELRLANRENGGLRAEIRLPGRS